MGMGRYFIKIPHKIINKKLTDHAKKRMESRGINIDQIQDALESKDSKVSVLRYKKQQQRYKVSVNRKNLNLNVIVCTNNNKPSRITQIVTSFYTEFQYNIGTGIVWLSNGFSKGKENTEKTEVIEEEKLKQAIIENFLNPQVFIPPFLYKFFRNEAGLTIGTLVSLLDMKDINYKYIINIEEHNITPTKEFERRFKEFIIKQLFNKDVVIPVRESNQRQHLIKFEFINNNWQRSL